MEHQEIKGGNMDEIRLIDANMMAVEETEAYISAQTSGKISPITQVINSVVHRKIQQLIANTPTVDLETLPIVRQLRKELATIKDILGDTYDLDRLRELVTAYNEGRYIIMKDAEREGVSRLVELAEADREGRVVVLPSREAAEEALKGEQE